MRRMITDKLTKNIKEIVAAYQAGEIGAKVEVANITAIDGAILTDLKAGDIVVKKTGNMRHTYVVTYKEENQGICMSYFAAGYLETVSYDYVTNAWVYNSTDVVNITDDYALKSELPAAVSGTNDGTNWTSLTINNDTYDIPQGGGSGSQLYQHNLYISYNNNTTGDNLFGIACLISSDDTAITKDNIVAKLIAAGYDSSVKRLIMAGKGYFNTAAQYCTLMGLGRQSNSNTNIRLSYVREETPNGLSAGSLQIDTTDTEVSLNIGDTVITL